MQVACWQNAIVSLIVLPFAVDQLPALAALDWLWVALLGVFCTGLSHYLFVSSLTRLNARSAGLVIALEPVYAIGFAGCCSPSSPACACWPAPPSSWRPSSGRACARPRTDPGYTALTIID